MTATMTPDVLARRLDGDELVTIVDVRTGGEFEAGHIPGSYNVPLDALGEHRRELCQVRRDVVLVCQSGDRAAKAEAQLAAAGMSHVHVLAGGMNAWQAAGQPVRRLRERWSLERQVRLVAGAIVLASVVASVFVPALVWIAGALGAGLVFAALTNTCAMGMLLARLPYNRPNSCDIDGVVAQLVRSGSRDG
jgi:rhodanese-related sulfurtransferase